MSDSRSASEAFDPSRKMPAGRAGPACPYPALPPPLPVALATPPEADCAYLPGRKSLCRGLFVEALGAEIYHEFMDRGFRRAGRVLYQPICRGCRACMPVRVPVADFRASKSQRRAMHANADLEIALRAPEPAPEKFDLYSRYLAGQHGRAEPERFEDFAAFLYNSPVATLEFEYRDAAGRLLAVGICDACSRSLSSVYFYYDPEERRRGLGVFGALTEIAFARDAGIPHYYLGYWIEGCGSMEYKDQFRPNELLHPDGVWRPWRKP